jgi:prepilin-type N-terminal cleavage/methylation domain-containing protein
MTKRAFTLVELIVAALIAVLMLTAVYKLMSNWMRSSVKGTSHLSNIQVAVLISSQIEHDLQRATSIDINADGFQIRTLEDIGNNRKELNVTYEKIADNEGLRRIVNDSGGIIHEKLLGENFRVNEVNGESILQKISFPDERFAIKILFEVASPKNEEPHVIQKMIFCQNCRENLMIRDWKD